MGRIYGPNAIRDVLATAPGAVREVLCTPTIDASEPRLLSQIAALKIPLRRVAPDALRERAGSRGGAAIAAEVRDAAQVDLARLDPDDPATRTLVALDQVTDPHNLGAILRSAAVFGACAVVVPKDHAAPLNDAAIRAAAGASALVPIVRVTNLARTLRELEARGFWTCAVTGDAPADAWSTSLGDRPLCVVLGAEGEGIRPLVRRACQMSVRIRASGSIQTLNVSVAAGVILGEVARQRAAIDDLRSGLQGGLEPVDDA